MHVVIIYRAGQSNFKFWCYTLKWKSKSVFRRLNFQFGIKFLIWVPNAKFSNGMLSSQFLCYIPILCYFQVCMLISHCLCYIRSWDVHSCIMSSMMVCGSFSKLGVLTTADMFPEMNTMQLVRISSANAHIKHDPNISYCWENIFVA